MHTQLLQVPQGKLAYSDFGGAGQLVIMLPGMGALRSEYRFLAPQLTSAGFRAVTMDLRGHGDSSVPWKTYDIPSVGGDILAMIEHLGGRPAHLIGTSFAAAPLVWVAAERPDCVRSLTLIGPFARTVKMNPVMGALFWLMIHNPWRVSAWTMYYATLYPTQKPSDFRTYLDMLKQNLSQPGRFDAAIALANSSRQPAEERFAVVQAPSLVIMGTKDPDFPDPTAEGKAIAELTRGSLELISGAGHYPQTEMPEKTGPIIVKFLKQVE